MRWLVVAITAILSSCATIQNYRTLEQPQNQTLTASVGGTIFRLNRTSDLPNVLGKADLYGGKVNKGYAEVKFLSVNDKGELVLQVTDVNISSSETTMDRYRPRPVVDVSQSVNISGTSVPESTTFALDPKRQNELVVAGIKVRFVNVQPYSVSYVLQDSQ